MHRMLLAVVALTGIGLGLLLGAVTGPSGGGASLLQGEAERDALRAEVVRLRMTLGERGADVARQPSDPLTGPVLGAGAVGGTDPDGPVERFDVASFGDANAAFRALLAYAATMLERGEEGHLVLLATLNATFVEEPGAGATARLLGGGERTARYLYPALRFALIRQDQVAAMTETVFKVLAEDPTRFTSIDESILELFTERIAYALPGIVGPERLRAYEAYAVAILATPAERQPATVQRVRSDVQRALDSWRPALTAEEALAELERGPVSAERAAALLARLGPDLLRSLDLDAVLGPLLATEGFRVLGLLGSLTLAPDAVARLDRRVLAGLARGGSTAAFLQYYLRATGRGAFAGARDFLEEALRQDEAAAPTTVAEVALGLDDGPDAAWVRWLLGRHAVAAPVRRLLEERLR